MTSLYVYPAPGYLTLSAWLNLLHLTLKKNNRYSPPHMITSVIVILTPWHNKKNILSWLYSMARTFITTTATTLASVYIFQLISYLLIMSCDYTVHFDLGFLIGYFAVSSSWFANNNSNNIYTKKKNTLVLCIIQVLLLLLYVFYYFHY